MKRFGAINVAVSCCDDGVQIPSDYYPIGILKYELYMKVFLYYVVFL